MALCMRPRGLVRSTGPTTLPPSAADSCRGSIASSASTSASSAWPASARLQWRRIVPTVESVPIHSRSPSQRGCRASGGGEGVVVDGGEDRSQWDVSSNCVKPVFRITPLASPDSNGVNGNKAHILFLSEGNVCRSIYAEAIFNVLLKRQGLQDLVSCSSKATRDYNVGETADPRAVMVAEEYGLELPQGKVATVFDCSTDIVTSDLVLVMDKFTASDALKEVTVYEIVNKEGRYSSKVRRLGEFCQTQQLEDIDDPLYGNLGGAEEMELVRQIFAQVRDSCEGLIGYIMDLQANLEESESLKDGVARGLRRMDALNWLAPPMLSRV